MRPPYPQQRAGKQVEGVHKQEDQQRVLDQSNDATRDVHNKSIMTDDHKEGTLMP